MSREPDWTYVFILDGRPDVSEPASSEEVREDMTGLLGDPDYDVLLDGAYLKVVMWNGTYRKMVDTFHIWVRNR